MTALRGGMTTPGPGPARPASRAAQVLALTTYELRLAARRGEGLLVTFAIPAGVLLVFGAFLPAEGGARPVDRLLPGSIALAVIAASLVALAIATGYERAYGVLKRLGGSPAGAGVVVIAKTSSVVVVEAVQLVLLVGIATVALGWTPGPGASVPLTLAGLVVGTAAFSGLGLLLAGTLRAEATLALANLLFLLALALGGIVVPLDRLPGVVTSVAEVLPPAALAHVLAVGLGGATSDATEPLLLLSGWAVALVALAARGFRWD